VWLLWRSGEAKPKKQNAVTGKSPSLHRHIWELEGSSIGLDELCRAGHIASTLLESQVEASKNAEKLGTLFPTAACS